MTEKNNQEKKFISLLNDTTFKYLWKEERCRKWLEEVILLVTGIDLKDYILVDNELNSGNKIKDYRLDIVLKKDNQIVNIEMNQHPKDYTLIKNHAYLYRLAGSTYLEGEDYTSIEVVQINFNNCLCNEGKDIGVSIYEFIDKENDFKIDGIKDYEIYLENYKGLCYNEANKKENYLAMFECENYSDMRALANNDKEALYIVDKLERLSEDKYFGALYDASIVQKKLENSAKKEGFAEGKKEGIKDTALAMLKDNVDINIISKYTGLSIEDIDKL